MTGPAIPPRALPSGTKTLRRAYVVTLVTLGTLSVGSNVILSAQMTASRSDTRLVALAGRQRMLSQRIAWDAQQLAPPLARLPAVQQAGLRADLRRSIGEFSSAHLRLRDPESGLYHARDAAEVRALYSGRLNASVQAFVAASTRVLNLPTGQLLAGNADVGWIEAQARGPLLAQLEQATTRAEQRSTGYISTLNRLAWIRVGLVLTLLTALGLFVLGPLERRNRNLLTSLTRERNFARTIIDTMGQGLAVTDARARFTHVNPALAAMLSHAPDSLTGQSLTDLVVPTERSALTDLLAQRAGAEPLSVKETQIRETQSQETQSREIQINAAQAHFQFRRKDGSVMSGMVNSVPLMGTDGLGAVTVITDLTAHETAERDVRDREARYRTLAAHFPEGAVVLFDRDLRYLLADGAGLESVGLRRETMEGNTVYDIFPPQIARAIAPDHLAALQGQSSVRELEFGSRTYLVQTFPVPGEEGVQYGTVIVRDVTGQVHARTALEQQAAELAQLAHEAESARQDALALAELTRSLGGARTLNDVTTSTFDLLVPSIGATWLALVKIREGQARLLALHGQVSPEFRTELEQHSAFLGQELWQAASLGPVYLTQTTEPKLAARGVTGLAIVPLPHKPERGLTVLVAGRRGQVAPWSGPQRALLEAGARTVCAAWERVALLDDLRLAAEHARALVEVSQLTEAGLSAQEVAQQACAIVGKVAGADWAGLVVAQNDQARTVTAYSSGRASRAYMDLMTRGLVRGQGVMWQVFDSGKANYVNDYAAHEGASSELIQAGARSVLWVPLARSHDLQFMLCAVRLYQKKDWSEQDQALFGAASRTVSMALERQKRLQELESAALNDRLTGLANRRAFELDLQRLAAEAARHQLMFTVVVIDLDGLKGVNDSGGHAHGDALLHTFGQRLKAAFRAEDRVYRLGGDEYALLLPHTAADAAGTGADLSAVRQRLRQTIDQTRAVGFPAAGASAGLSSFPLDGTAAADLVKLADHRMYAEKRSHQAQRLSAT
ncbi:diguanylate cyclase [Deinococcus sp. Arct2-2]|uniref:diguanylate cyclase domain-containing protein n=1 Tax=Deinococcus sp. Arct2-2 TaxID=2568653 RepID=UPI0010A46376|nr:diguanylate cyclase [Deinococcus sp. Arct2-2]THF70253.1 diguanylate cyclase [Deinococcus sp. Arct2-2]